MALKKILKLNIDQKNSMKNLFAILFVFAFTGSYAQIEISQKNVNIDGSKQGFYIEIPYGDVKGIEKELKDELKSWKGKFSTKGSTIFVDDCKIKDMGDNTFDVYAKVDELGELGASVSIAIDLGGAFLNSGEHGSQFKTMEDILYKWAVKAAKNFVDGEVKEEEKLLSDKEKELEDLQKDQEKMEKEIEDYKKKIEENEKAIEDSKKAQEDKAKEIEEQKAKVEEAKKKKDSIK